MIFSCNYLSISIDIACNQSSLVLSFFERRIDLKVTFDINVIN